MGGRNFYRWWLPQIVLALCTVGGAVTVVRTVAENLALRGITLDFGFLGNTARFPISETSVAYAPSDSFVRAFVAGLGNTVWLTILVIVVSTLVGIPLALARRSGHPLASTGARLFINAVRNTPLVVQLLFWYGVLTVTLPPPAQAVQPLPGVFLTDRGLYLTAFGITGAAVPMMLAVMAGLLATAVLTLRGRLHQASLATLATVVTGAALWIMLDLGLQPDVPRLDRYNFVGGTGLSPEFTAVMLGSVLYASAFAAEIIRSGIAGVGAGQWDGCRAMGLTDAQALRLVIVPQALRIIVPPMTTQFISILKNSTLALVVGYPDFNFIANTTMNHTGHALECVVIVMLVYLALALGISAVMAQVERATGRWAR